ncbi:MAG: sodium:solute symporter [Ruminococcus sp.]|nr:sodium:solute symporter [Ruminococcus sp.]
MVLISTITMFIVYVTVLLIIGVWTSKRTKTTKDFVLGGRDVGSWLTAFAYGTTYFSSVVFIGYSGQFGYTYGVSALWIGIGNALIGSLLPWLILGRRTRIMTKHLHATTMPEFFEKRWNSKGLKTISALIVFVFLIPYTASVYNGLSRLFAMAFGTDSDAVYMMIIVGMAVLTSVYVILGGYKAAAMTDFVQGVVMLGGITAVVFCVIGNQGGLTEALSKLGEIETETVKQGTLNSLVGPDFVSLMGVLVLTSLGTWGLPQMVQKFYAIKDEKMIGKGAVICTIFALIVSGGCYFMGGFDRLFVKQGGAGDFVVPTLSNGKLEFDAIIPHILETALPDVLIGLVIVLVLSASMSTLSSLVLTSSSTLTIDLIKPIKEKSSGKKLSDKNSLLIMRILIAAFLLLSVVIAFNKNASITTLMSYSWGALAGSFLGPFMWGLFSKKITKSSIYISFFLAIGITIAHMCIFSFGGVSFAEKPLVYLNSPINIGAFTMLLSVILVPLISAITKKPDKKLVDDVFECLASK